MNENYAEKFLRMNRDAVVNDEHGRLAARKNLRSIFLSGAMAGYVACHRTMRKADNLWRALGSHIHERI